MRYPISRPLWLINWHDNFPETGGFREIARISKCSHGSVSAQKKEFLARKDKEQKQKLDDLQKKITENKSDSPIDAMKAMNVSEDIIHQVQVKIETEARSKVHEITGGTGYETFD